MTLLRRLSVMLLLSSLALSQTPPAPAALTPPPATTRRVKVAPEAASALLIQKASPKYPDAARAEKLQGSVVLDVVIGLSGDVSQTTVVSGDSTLAQAAIEAVKQWKYKPYEVNGAPSEMETEVTFNFKLQPKPVTAPAPEPPLGTFGHDTYSNDFFGFSYPLSRDWVRETQLMQKRFASNGTAPRAYALLAAVYVPQNAGLSQVNSSFTLLAADLPDVDCKRYLDAIAANFQFNKEAQQKGDLRRLIVAGRDFVRADFEYRNGIKYQSTICSASKGFLLLWNIGSTAKNGVETAASTLQAISALPPKPAQDPAAPPASAQESAQPPESKSSGPKKVQVLQGVSRGLLIKKVTPIYPEEARHARIQGTVRMNAEISKTGDIVDLEVLDGPIELVVSAVNAVRQWKYRPYLLLGEPVDVETEIIVNYELR